MSCITLCCPNLEESLIENCDSIFLRKKSLTYFSFTQGNESIQLAAGVEKLDPEFRTTIEKENLCNVLFARGNVEM